MGRQLELMSRDELMDEVLLLRECIDGNRSASRLAAIQARYGLRWKACGLLLTIHNGRGDMLTLRSLERFISPVSEYPSRRAVEVHLSAIRRALGQDSLISGRRAWAMAPWAVAAVDQLLDQPRPAFTSAAAHQRDEQRWPAQAP